MKERKREKERERERKREKERERGEVSPYSQVDGELGESKREPAQPAQPDVVAQHGAMTDQPAHGTDVEIDHL